MTPFFSAAKLVFCIVGPSASGSLNAMPNSSMSDPASSTEVMTSDDICIVGNPMVTNGANIVLPSSLASFSFVSIRFCISVIPILAVLRHSDQGKFLNTKISDTHVFGNWINTEVTVIVKDSPVNLESSETGRMMTVGTLITRARKIELMYTSVPMVPENRTERLVLALL